MNLDTVNVTQGSTTDGHHSFGVITSGQTASLTYTFTMPRTGELFMYLPSIYERTINLTLNGESKGQYFEGDNNYMRNFGEFQQGAEITLVMTLTKDNLYFREAEFAVIDKEQVQTALNELKELNRDTDCYLENTTHVVTEVTCDTDRTLFTTIPDEKGWTVYVDGKKTDYIVTVDSLIAVPLTAGYHKVEMKFVTAGYPAAVLLSIAGVIIFAGIIILWLKRSPADRKRRRAHLRTIYSGEAYLALKQRDAEDKLERKRINGELDEDDDADEDDAEEVIIAVQDLSGSGGFVTELLDDDDYDYDDDSMEDTEDDTHD